MWCNRRTKGCGVGWRRTEGVVWCDRMTAWGGVGVGQRGVWSVPALRVGKHFPRS